MNEKDIGPHLVQPNRRFFAAKRKMLIKTARNIFIGFAVACVLLFDTVAASDDNAERAAAMAAEKWIALIDAGDYASSWQEASDVFQSAVDRKRWVHNVPLIRDPLGRVLTRTVDTVSFIANEPGMNDEQNAVVRFKTSFLNFESVTETVMLTPDKDGRWRIMGYYITSGFLAPQGQGAALLLLLVIAGAWYLELKPRRGVAKK